jgi:hypothetical protein
MQSQSGHNMPCVDVNVNVHNDCDNRDDSMTTSPVPSEEHRQESTSTMVSPSLVSLDSYGVFPVDSSNSSENNNNMKTMVVTYHGEDGHGDDHGAGAGVATAHTMFGTTSVGVGATASATAGAVSHYYDKPMDDLDLMLQHQDFAQLVTLAVKVKQARLQVAEACAAGVGGAAAAAAGKTRQASTALEPSEVLDAVSRLQDQLLASGPNVNSNGGINGSSTIRGVIPRGVYPITDSIMDDSLETLQKELDRCFRCLEQQGEYGGATSNAMTAAEPTASSADGTTTNTKKRGRNKKEAIAVKYSKWQTDILMNWMIENKDQPFPDQDEIKNLMRMTGLSHSQVVNWTTNVRKRNRKATCQNGKKPHHFIDFLFLAQDRENRQKKQKAQEQQAHKHQQHQQQVKAIKVESPDGTPTPYSAPSYHHQQQQQQQQQRRQQKQQPQQPQQRQQHQEAYPSPKQQQSSSSVYAPPQEAYPSPKQQQSSSAYAPPQEAYPSPKQQQSSSVRFMAPADNEYHYHNHHNHHNRHNHYNHHNHRSSGHPGSPSYTRNKPSEPMQKYGNTWEHAPSLQTVHSGSALEPLLIDDMSEVILLDDFSSVWFDDEPHPNHDSSSSSNHATTTAVKSESDNDMVDVLEYHQHQHHYTMAHQDVHGHAQPLMPSVTDDQDAAAMPDHQHSRSNKRMRVMAVDHVDLDELDDMKLDDINDWAADLGFVVEI